MSIADQLPPEMAAQIHPDVDMEAVVRIPIGQQPGNGKVGGAR